MPPKALTIALVELSQELNLFRGELRLHVGFLQFSHCTIGRVELPHNTVRLNNARACAISYASILTAAL